MLTAEKTKTIKIPDDIAEDFDPVKIFECGQCFRWNADEKSVYRGIAGGIPAKVYEVNGAYYIETVADAEESFWTSYFDFETDYAQARKSICIDEYMKRASDFGKGIRILRQDPWEALCSFIISQCNNIPRIKGIVERLCLHFGEEREFDGTVYRAFPDVSRIAALEPEELAPLRCGYRAPYIINAARAVDSGRLDLYELGKKDCETALEEIRSIRGVGAKVANCFILFGLHKLDAFPIDVWMKRALKEHYGGGFDPAVFGSFAGLAQQYMFYYARSGEN